MRRRDKRAVGANKKAIFDFSCAAKRLSPFLEAGRSIVYDDLYTTITAFYGTIILCSDSVERGIKRGDNFVDLNYVALFIGVLRVVKQFYICISDRGAVCYILIDLVCIN